MGLTLEGTKVARSDGVRKLDATVAMSQLAFDALRGAAVESPNETALRMEGALRCYLGDKGADRPAWRYPGFLRGSETREDVDVEFTVDRDLWGRFEEEAAAQGVSVEQLAEHAAFYFAAEVEAGRLTQRILDDLEPIGNDEAA
jgi:hypothetical protein